MVDLSSRKSPLSDAQANRLVKLYDQGEKEILQNINKMLLKNPASRSALYQKQVLDRVRQIRGDLLSGARTWTHEAPLAGYIEGFKWADADALAGKGIIAGFGSIHQQAISALADQAYSRLVSVDNTIARTTEDIFSTIAQKQSLGAVVGYKTTLQAAKGIEKDLAEHGVTGFVDRSGREWDMGRYTKMLAQETVNQSFRTGTANRLMEHGHDLVIVSEHDSSCPDCAEFQGEVFSLSGNDPYYPPLSEAEDGGLFHVGCLHVLSLAPEEADLFIGALEGDQGDEARDQEIQDLIDAYDASHE